MSSLGFLSMSYKHIRISNQARRILRFPIKRTKRFFLKDSDSFPYISGDAFSNRCDISITRESLQIQNYDKDTLTQARSIFVEGHSLREFLRLYGPSVQNCTLIAGNSDENYSSEWEEFDLLSKQNVSIYLQNLNFVSVNDSVQLLPIGVENLRLAENGLRFSKNKISDNVPFDNKMSTVLVGPFSSTHHSRENLIQEFGNRKYFETRKDRISPKRYFKLLQQHKYVLCPPGNGHDTHRFWETLYSGAIPIVQESEWLKRIIEFGFPVLVVANFTPEDVLQAVFNSKIERFDPFEFPPLWMPYWITKMKLSVKNLPNISI